MKSFSFGYRSRTGRRQIKLEGSHESLRRVAGLSDDDDAFGPYEIKPFGSGVAAICETPDDGKTVMLMCAEDGAPRLVIADKVFGDGKELQDAVSVLSGIDALGLKLPGRNASVVKGR